LAFFFNQKGRWTCRLWVDAKIDRQCSACQTHKLQSSLGGIKIELNQEKSKRAAKKQNLQKKKKKMDF
jgi:RNA polymerase subunit RPABC4/transcription elongation factor Spt4